MAQYATIEDMEALRGSEHIRALSDKDNTGQRIDSVINGALERATSHADSYIEKKYQVPLANPPAHLVQAVIDVAEWYMVHDGVIGTEDIRRRYEDAMALFKSIGKGESTLAGNAPANSGTTDPATGATGTKNVQVITKDRYFTRNSEIL